jgi:hypothetical protein
MTDHTSDHRRPAPGRSPASVLAALDTELSRRDRLRYVLVLLASLTVSSLVGTLWATEPGLPLRTHLAFGGLVTLGVGWMAVTGYVLSRRRPLYAADRVLATGMAVVATVVVGTASTTVAVLRAGAITGVTVGAVTATLAGAAIVLHRRARTWRSTLLDRRRELEHQRAA